MTVRMGSLLRRIDVRAGIGAELEPLLSVSQTRGVIRHSELHDRPARADSFEAYKRVEAGDIVFNKMSIRSGALGVAAESGIVTYHYEVMRPRVGVDSRFAVYLMKSEWFTSELIRSERGIGAGGAAGVRTTEVPYNVLRTIRVRDWSPSEQRQIAAYLDYETAEIDAFIADLVGLKELTRERLLSEWSRLYQVASAAPSAQVRHVLSSLVDGPFGSALTSGHYADSGLPVVRLGNIGRFRFRIEPRVFIPVDYAAQLSRHNVRPGDVVIAGLGDGKNPLGRSAVVPDEFGEGIVKADCYRARVNDRVSPSYLAWSLSAPQTGDSFRELSRGSTRSRLNLGLVAGSRIPIPDRSNQQQLVGAFRREEALAEAAIADIDAAIILAKERRAALITAAVTGQIDVTARQRPLADSIQRELEDVR